MYVYIQRFPSKKHLCERIVSQRMKETQLSPDETTKGGFNTLLVNHP